MKNYSPLLIIFIFFTNYSFSQTDSAWKYAEAITQSGLKEQLSIIASAGMEGRETGTEGQRKAAAYIESQFKKAGLTSPASLPGFQQSYPLLKDTLIPKTLKIGKRRYDFGTDYMVTPGTDETSEFNANDIIFAGYGIADINYNDYEGKDVKGKVVVIFTGEPQIGDTFLVNGSTKRSVWGFSLSKKSNCGQAKRRKSVISSQS